MTPLEINRGVEPTSVQAIAELMVDAAERALPGLIAAPDQEVPDTVRLAAVDLCWLLVENWGKATAFVRVRPGPLRDGFSGRRVPGVRLSRAGATTAHGDLQDPYAMVLVTHFTATQTVSSQRDRELHLLDDGFGPTPLRFLSGERFRHAFPGLLRLVEKEVKSLASGDDYNWGRLEGGDEGLDDKWHPDELLKRVRAMRWHARKTLCVAEVLHA